MKTSTLFTPMLVVPVQMHPPLHLGIISTFLWSDGFLHPVEMVWSAHAPLQQDCLALCGITRVGIRKL